MFSLRTQTISLSVGQHFDSLAENLQKNQINLATGYRIHSAIDDAAGLQIATRLETESRGQRCAMQNIENGISYLQTAEGVLSEVSNNLLRMRDLAVLAANGTNSSDDENAFSAEYSQLEKQIHSMIKEAKFGGESLFGINSQLYKGSFQLQIGEGAAQNVTVDEMAVGAKSGLKQLFSDFDQLQLGHVFKSKSLKTHPFVMTSPSYPGGGGRSTSGSTSSGSVAPVAPFSETLLDHLDRSIHSLSHIRSSLGGIANGLQSQYRNLVGMHDATLMTKGRIVDADYAEETAQMLANQMLMQSSGAMVRQSKSLNQLTGMLIQMV